ncbi:TonB-dependent receptor domain-containing protein [Erythrobacter donghaensis]|jgi:outer membrane receptor protein involved in Fe transport|uniref:TonB-dependent receptor domain-containing protein n=1 Tax=Erythrobacter donghaensis TaxID=267135 RepID=UPI0009C18E25|nr:TonB-dependent receptor [Erythrobacter donghaensis]
MRNLTAFGRRVGLLSGVGLAAFAFASPALAQDAEDEEAVVTTEEAPEESKGIVVTGSRIRLPNLTPTEPTNTIDGAYIENRNFINVADALNDLPQIRGSVTPDGGQSAFGQGVNFINNFGLGTNRTLTLVNGRRVVSANTPSLFGPAAPGLQVDLNIIPTALVKQIDIASTAGAPVYGSDAIAGTVNIILDDQYEGLYLNGTTSITEEGDGFSYRFEGVYGTSFADNRGHLQVSSFYTQTDGILQTARQVFRDEIETQQNTILTGRINPNLPLNTSATDGVPDTVLFSPSRIFALTPLGLIINGPGGVTTAGSDVDGIFNNAVGAFQFNAAGNLVPFNPGTRPLNTNGTANGIRGIGGDPAFQFSDFGQLTSDLRRFGANLFLNYDVTDNINLFVEAQYYDARADELVQQPTFNSTLFGGLSSALTFTLDNPFLNDQARGVLQAAGVTNTFTVARANIAFADLTGFAETELLRGVVGARGDFQLGEKDWNWEVSFNYGNTDITDFRQDINAQNFINATNVTRNAQGQIVCNATPTTRTQAAFAPVADARCVPLNFFGDQASAAAIDYIVEDSASMSSLEQVVVNANVGGTPFALFGNDVGLNIGYEYRRESGDFRPSEFDRQGLGRGAAVSPVSGSFELNEVFGELYVPLITPENDALIESAIVYGRGRYVDNTINGGFFSWAAGGSIAPVRDIEFRGNFTRSFRAPALTELFLPRSNAFGFIPDLCLPQSITAAPDQQVRQRNCDAFLGAFPNISRPQIASQASIPIVSGGNPNLDNEQADSWSVGVIVKPWFLRNFSLTVDYINISISDPIASLTTAQINSACFDNPVFDTSDPANGNQFCSLIRRDATGEVISDPQNPGVTTGFVNGQSIDYEGIVASMLYASSLENLGIPGTLQLRGDLNVTLFRQTNITGIAPVPTHGTIGDEQFVGQLAANYLGKNWGFGSVVNYTGEGLFSRVGRTPDAREFDQLEDFVTVDFNVYFETNDNFRLNFVVNNAFDRRCQSYFGFCIPASINDAFGRTFSASVTKKF